MNHARRTRGALFSVHLRAAPPGLHRPPEQGRERLSAPWPAAS